jgi:hypothetical protein
MIKPERSASVSAAIAFLMLVSLIAATLLYSPGTEDIRTWLSWIDDISTQGLIGGFAYTGNPHPHDYPPLAFVILAAVNWCAGAFGADPFVVLKCSLLLFLFTTSVCFYSFTRNLILTAALEFSLILSSVSLGYLDIWFAPFLIAGLFCLQRGHLKWGVVLFAISCFIKWQPVIIAPFICLYVLSMNGDGKISRNTLLTRTIPFALAAIVVALPLAVVFGMAIVQSLQRAMTHTYFSGLAMNLPWLHTWLLHVVEPEKYGALVNGQISLIHVREGLVKLPEKVLFYASYGAVFFAFARQKKTFERLIVYSMLGYLAYFIFNTGVHENHLFLVVCLAWILAFVDSSQLMRCINLSIVANINPILFYGFFGQGLPFDRLICGIDTSLVFAAVNVCLFVELLVHTFKADGFRFDLGGQVAPSNARESA